MAAVETIDVIRQNLELAKEQLKNVDNDIKRLTGRDPSEDRFTRKAADPNFKRPNVKPSIRAPVIRSSILDSLNDEKQKAPDDDLQVSLSSTVVPVSETRSRLEALKGMRKSDKDRGRRMLGILQSTLSQFQAESAAATSLPQMTKRRQVDAKVEARERKEKESLRRERAQLFRSRREQQIEIGILQQKIRMAKSFEQWRTEMEKMVGFCRTKTKPHIFFRPVIHTDESRYRVEETAKAVHDMIRQRQRKMDRALEESSILRRRQLSLHSEQDRLGDDEDDKGEEGVYSGKRYWSPSRQRPGTRTSSPESIGSPCKKPRIQSAVSTGRTASRATDSGEVSDSSDTFAIEGDGEPVIMDEDHLLANNQPHDSPPARSGSGKTETEASPISELADTRTVRLGTAIED